MSRRRSGAGYAAAVTLLCVVSAASLAVGVVEISLWELHRLVVDETGSMESIVVQSVRLPRLAAGLCVGAALGLSGALLQTITANALAAPGLLGVTAGAAFAIVFLVAFVDASPDLWIMASAAIVGAATAGSASFVLSGGLSRQGTTTIRLVLAGAVVSLCLGSLTGAIMLYSADTIALTRTWLAGSLADRPSGLSGTLSLLIVATALPVAFLARPLDVLALGERQATALGVNTFRVKILGLLAATSIAALAVALAGPIGFVGLVGPHIARGIFGSRPAQLLPASALLGALLLVTADVFARLVVFPAEIAVGVTTTLIGVPVFFWLLRSRRL